MIGVLVVVAVAVLCSVGVLLAPVVGSLRGVRAEGGGRAGMDASVATASGLDVFDQGLRAGGDTAGR